MRRDLPLETSGSLPRQRVVVSTEAELLHSALMASHSWSRRDDSKLVGLAMHLDGHLGRLLSTPARVPEYQGRGIGRA